jgi:hypothetical protein
MFWLCVLSIGATRLRVSEEGEATEKLTAFVETRIGIQRSNELTLRYNRHTVADQVKASSITSSESFISLFGTAE